MKKHFTFSTCHTTLITHVAVLPPSPSTCILSPSHSLPQVPRGAMHTVGMAMSGPGPPYGSCTSMCISNPGFFDIWIRPPIPPIAWGNPSIDRPQRPSLLVGAPVGCPPPTSIDLCRFLCMHMPVLVQQ